MPWARRGAKASEWAAQRRATRVAAQAGRHKRDRPASAAGQRAWRAREHPGRREGERRRNAAGK
jgi:hypothetical protein